MILCFSGTGNSRYIAKRMADALEDEIVDLNTKIKTKDTSPIQTGNRIIVITPTYAWRIPKIVSDCLLKTDLLSAKKIWFVMDCGLEIGNASKYNGLLAKEKKLEYMGTMQIVMPENYIAMFKVPNVNQAREIVKDAQAAIEKAIDCVKKESSFPTARNNLYDRIMSGRINPIFYRFIVKANAFQVDSNCIGCGLCVKKCPMNNIKLIDRKPVWDKYCTHCMACISYCPKKSIEYGKKSIGKPRYHFEDL